MKEKILESTLKKIFDLSSKDMLCPTSDNLKDLSLDEISSFYQDAWSLICEIHSLCFSCSQAQDLLKKLDL